MFKLAVAILALAAVGTQARPQYDPFTYDCADKADGLHPVVADPKAFYACKDGAIIERNFCTEGTVFNGVDTCVPEVEQEEKTEVGEEEVPEERERSTIPQVYTDDNDDGFFDDDFEGGNGKKLIYNIEFTKNIFPKSVVIIGKMNREQKNK